MYSPDRDDDNRTSGFERHLQTGIQLILIGLLAWSGAKLVTLGESTAVLRERLIYQGEQIAHLRRDLRDWSDLYQKKQDAERDMQAVDSRFSVVNSRLESLEAKSQ